MKKWLIAVFLLSGTVVAQSETLGINRSSFTQTNDTTQCLTGAHFLDSVIVGAASAGGSLTLYNSTWTTTPIISSASLGTVQTQYFNNLAVAGICYKTISNTNGVLIIYKK